MSAEQPKTWGLIGGAGFIGQHLASSILQQSEMDSVVLVDLVEPSNAALQAQLKPHFDSGCLIFEKCDVRDSEQLLSMNHRFDVLVNLAAIHREPGHRPEEFFETNIAGAKNICALAEQSDCQELIFTSSISVYGIHDRPVDESTSVSPKTPYGQSKHQAEKIQIDWARNTGKRLSIVRPGVVFGPGESGNVTRLMREMLKRERPISLSTDQAKAGIYIEELIGIIHWLRGQDLTPGDHHLVNAVSNENLTFNAFGNALKNVKNLSNQPLRVPTGLIKSVCTLAGPLTPLFSATSKFHPERLAKICRANDIRATSLGSMGYPFAWPLSRALQDWLIRGI